VTRKTQRSQGYVSDVTTGLSHSLGAGLGFVVFDHAKLVEVSSLLLFFFL